jgi:hypothetical protein
MEYMDFFPPRATGWRSVRGIMPVIEDQITSLRRHNA